MKKFPKVFSMCVSKEVVFDQLKPGILWHIQTVHFPEKGGVHCTLYINNEAMEVEEEVSFSCYPNTFPVLQQLEN